MSDIRQELLEYIRSLRIISTHNHHLNDEDYRGVGLRELLEHRKQRLNAGCGKLLRTMGQTLRLRLSGKLSELPCTRIADADSVGRALH